MVMATLLVDLFIERGHIVTCRDAREIEHASREVLVEEAGTTGILSRGFRSDPDFQFLGRRGVEQSCEEFQVNAFMLEGEGQMARQRLRRASSRGILFMNVTVLAHCRARFADGTVGAKRLDGTDAVPFGHPAITDPVRHLESWVAAQKTIRCLRY